MTQALANAIEQAWESRDTLNTQTRGEVREAVEAAIDLLDSGEARVASPNGDGNWTVHQWLKKAFVRCPRPLCAAAPSLRRMRS